MMKFNCLPLFALAVLSLTACQKDYVLTIPGSTTTDTTGGKTDGNLLVKGYTIDQYNDTGFLYVKWDANKRLVNYTSYGTVNKIATNAVYDITRASNGHIITIFQKPFAVLSGGIDSAISKVYYKPNSDQLAYVITTQYTVIFNIKDSAVFTYNSAGKVQSKEEYLDNPFTGLLEKSSKQTYTYDASGNVLTTTSYAPDASGNYVSAGSKTNTYDNHVAPAIMGEEAYIFLGAENTSPNNITKTVQTSGTNTVTGTISEVTFNSYNRPVKVKIGITPVPPGYSVTAYYFYQ